MEDDRCEIGVVYDGRWNVQLNGRNYGPFPSEETARDAAIGAGCRAVKIGMDTTISIDPTNIAT